MFEGQLNPLLRFTVAEGTVKCAVVDAGNLIADMQTRHKLGPVETLLLGRALIAASLLSTTIKGSDRLITNIECEGPAGGLSVECGADGGVRGYLKNNPVIADSNIKTFNELIGNGVLSVSKFVGDRGMPFTGTVNIKHSDIALDLAEYYTVSEQIPTALLLSVNISPEGKLEGAGGILVQALPGASDSVLSEINGALDFMVSPGLYFSSGKSLDDYAEEYFSEFKINIKDKSHVRYFCGCSRGRYKGFLGNLKLEELNDIYKEDVFPVKIQCHNCCEVYEFSKEEIEKMIYKAELQAKHGRQI